MNVDVIILTNSLNEHSVSMTKRTMITMNDSEKDFIFNFHIVESGNDFLHSYSNLSKTYIRPDEKFNYNRFINFAVPYIKFDWVVITNNDVGYEKGWFSEIMRIHSIRPDIHSFSPKDSLYHSVYYPNDFVGSKSEYFESYQVSRALMGWSIVIKKESFDKIIPFDEQFDMYYQDNDYGEVLKLNNIKHAICRHSIASHLNTLNILELTDAKITKMTEDEKKFRDKWKIYQ